MNKRVEIRLKFEAFSECESLFVLIIPSLNFKRDRRITKTVSVDIKLFRIISFAGIQCNFIMIIIWTRRKRFLIVNRRLIWIIRQPIKNKIFTAKKQDI